MFPNFPQKRASKRLTLQMWANVINTYYSTFLKTACFGNLTPDQKGCRSILIHKIIPDETPVSAATVKCFMRQYIIPKMSLCLGIIQELG